MKLNGIRKIDNNGGAYLVLTDYGHEGIAVSHQCNTAEEAAQWMMSSCYSSPHAVVKVVQASISLENTLDERARSSTSASTTKPSKLEMTDTERKMIHFEQNAPKCRKHKLPPRITFDGCHVIECTEGCRMVDGENLAMEPLMMQWEAENR